MGKARNILLLAKDDEIIGPMSYVVRNSVPTHGKRPYRPVTCVESIEAVSHICTGLFNLVVIVAPLNEMSDLMKSFTIASIPTLVLSDMPLDEQHHLNPRFLHKPSMYQLLDRIDTLSRPKHGPKRNEYAMEFLKDRYNVLQAV